MEITTIPIKDHINSDYRTYALYVIESRGIPNFYDSLTPVQRLILLHAPEKFQKTVALVGSVMATGLYHHGDMSLTKAINKMTKSFGCSRTLLIGDGFFGTPVNPKPASSRYTSVKNSQYSSEIVKKYFPINVRNNEGNYNWLHVDTPLALCGHTVGIAVGYRSNILPRKIEDVLEYLDGKNKQLKPHFAGFNGQIKKHPEVDRGWILEGMLTADDKTMMVKIGDLPPLIKYSSFIKTLHEKLDALGGNYKLDNNSTKAVDISIKWRDASTYQDMLDVVNKLTKIVVIENIIFIKDGCVVEYESIMDYLDEFNVHRNLVIHKKMLYDLDVSNDELDFLRAKREFLLFMLEKKRKNEEIITFIGKYNNKIKPRLDAIKLTALSPETVKKVEEEIREMEKSIVEQKKAAEKQLKLYKDMNKKLVPKGKINMNKSYLLFEEDDPSRIDGIDVFGIEEDEEEDIEEEDDQ